VFREEGFASLGWRETLLSRGDSRAHRDKRQVSNTRRQETIVKSDGQDVIPRCKSKENNAGRPETELRDNG